MGKDFFAFEKMAKVDVKSGSLIYLHEMNLLNIVF